MYRNERDSTKIITTTQIFNLIALSKKYLHTNVANILDLSCNVVPLINKSDVSDNCNGFSISGNCYTPEDDWAYGGTKRKTKSQRKTRRYKKK